MATRSTKPSPVLDRYDTQPHIEDVLSMTLREWMVWNHTMHRHHTRYLGRKVLKSPFDWIVLGDIIQDTQPEVIIEIGSWEGGMALWMCHLLDAMGASTKVIGVDITERPTAVKHPRLQWVIGNALSPETIKRVEDACESKRGMVIEDSDHKEHVTRELMELYYKFVAPGCYLLIEDTLDETLNLPPFPGPLNAVKEFMSAHGSEFVVDRAREKYLMTYNPMGYLLRLPAGTRA